ncbi:unnamed protein product, partial [Ixodes hexagonus]
LLFFYFQRKVLDGSLGFAAGVMLAASFWSLLAPAIEIAETSGYYGQDGRFAFVPVALGFLLGALFVYAMDKVIPSYDGHKADVALAMQVEKQMQTKRRSHADEEPTLAYTNGYSSDNGDVRKSTSTATALLPRYSHAKTVIDTERLLTEFLVEQNLPLSGLAVGVGFGAAGSSEHSTFESARNLALGIGIQNFPEGLAVSLPLRGAGFSRWKAFWYGQLSGAVEPIAGVLGCLAVTMAQPILPYALAFAAGAMVYVVVDDIVPEAQTW